MGRFTFLLITFGGFLAGVLAGGALGAYLAVTDAPREPAPAPARFVVPMQKPSAGLNSAAALPVQAQKAVLKRPAVSN